jgi:hypothetical protein
MRNASLPTHAYAHAPPPPPLREPPLEPLRLPLACALCVTEGETAACLDCPETALARYGHLLHERRAVARMFEHRYAIHGF